MAITIRRAESRDLDKTLKLLSEVLELHAKIRPDIFISGTTKYTREELQAIFNNDQTPVFVASGDSGEVVGYAFCVMKRQPFSTNMKDFSTLFIDDSEPILDSAAAFGIRYCLGVTNPDSGLADKSYLRHPGLGDYRQMIPSLTVKETP